LGYLVGSVSNLYTNKRIAAGETLKVTVDMPNGTPSYYVTGDEYISKFDNFSQVLFNKGTYSLTTPKLLEFSANTGTDELPLF